MSLIELIIAYLILVLTLVGAESALSALRCNNLIFFGEHFRFFNVSLGKYRKYTRLSATLNLLTDTLPFSIHLYINIFQPWHLYINIFLAHLYFDFFASTFTITFSFPSISLLVVALLHP